MDTNNAQNLLAANCGTRRVTTGWDDDAKLRELSDARALTRLGGKTPVIFADAP